MATSVFDMYSNSIYLGKDRRLTWVELLPRDARCLIRKYLAKSDFSREVLPELMARTAHRRKYITDCSDIETGEFCTPGLIGMHHPRPQFQNLAQVLAWRNRLHVLEINQGDAKVYHQDYESEEMANFFINHDMVWECTFIPIYDEIFNELALRVDELHGLVRNIKREYDYHTGVFSTTGAPPWESSAFAQNTFRQYVSSYAIVGHYRNLLTQFVNQIVYNCGHLPSVYERALQVSGEIYRMDV